MTVDEQPSRYTQPSLVFTSGIWGRSVGRRRHKATQRSRAKGPLAVTNSNGTVTSSKYNRATWVSNGNVVDTIWQVVRLRPRRTTVEGDITLVCIDVAVHHATVGQGGENRPR